LTPRAGQRGVAIAENDRHRHPDRASQTANGVGAEVRVLVHSRRHLGMRQLHQQRSPSSKQKDVLAVDPQRDRVLFEKPGPQAVAFAISALKSSTSGL
jgi:hypothetical protein